jgi:hypothetical protein
VTPRQVAKWSWTLANGIFLLLFVFAAVVQFNDPDPLSWIAIYGIAALVCAMELRRKTPVWAPTAVALIALVWSASIFYRVRDIPFSTLFAEWEMRDVRVEEAREMYGLTIVAVWMIIIGIAHFTQRTTAAESLSRRDRDGGQG